MRRSPSGLPARRGACAALLLACLLACAPKTAGADAEADADVESESGAEAAAPSPMTADEEWIVSATRVPFADGRRPFQATALTGERLDAGISPSVVDALRFVPGLHVVQEGAPGGRAALSLRGLDPNHVVVLVDGVRVNDPTNSRGGSFDPSTLALVDIEKIEIVRGPLSSIHGADALAGVVQIVTRRVEADAPLRARARARGGRFHFGEVAGQASGGLGGVAGLSLGAAGSTSRDPSSDGGFDAGSLHAKLAVPLPAALDLEAFARLHGSSARGFPESSGGPELATLRAMEDRNTREVSAGAALTRTLFAGQGHLRLQAGLASRREELESPGIGPGIVPPARLADEYRRWDVSLVGDGSLPGPGWPGFAEGPRLVAGIAGIWEDGESDGALDFGGGFVPFPFYDTRRTLGVFGELEQGLGEHVVVSGSLRFDATPDEEDRLSPALGLVSAIPGTPLSVFGRYGQGFRRPSFYALGNPLVGNRELGVERSRGWEAGLRLRSADGRVRAQLGYFDLEVENLHDFDAQLFQIVGRGRLVSRGAELEFGLRPVRPIELIGALSFNPTDFGGSGRPPLNRPRWRGFAELHARPFEDWDFALRVLAVGSSKASAAATGGRIVTLAGYERIDWRTTWTPTEGLELFLEIENLTNRTHREAVGFESPGIAPRSGIAVHR